jgi:hypothetical protein
MILALSSVPTTLPPLKVLEPVNSSVPSTRSPLLLRSTVHVPRMLSPERLCQLPVPRSCSATTGASGSSVNMVAKRTMSARFFFACMVHLA